MKETVGLRLLPIETSPNVDDAESGFAAPSNAVFVMIQSGGSDTMSVRMERKFSLH